MATTAMTATSHPRFIADPLWMRWRRLPQEATTQEPPAHEQLGDCAAGPATAAPSATPPQSIGIGAASDAAGCPCAGWAASQAETALMSAGVSAAATFAMQSGDRARRLPPFQAPSWALR
jgi:hypothetical protein